MLRDDESKPEAGRAGQWGSGRPPAVGHPSKKCMCVCVSSFVHPILGGGIMGEGGKLSANAIFIQICVSLC